MDCRIWFAEPNKLKCAMERRPTRGWSLCISGLKERGNWKNRRQFHQFLNNQWGCGKVDYTVEFRASNIPKWPLEGSSNHRGRRPGEGILKQKNGVRFWLQGMNQWRYSKTDGTIGFMASNISNYTLEGHSNGGGRVPWMVSFKIGESGAFLIIETERR